MRGVIPLSLTKVCQRSELRRGAMAEVSMIDLTADDDNDSFSDYNEVDLTSDGGKLTECSTFTQSKKIKVEETTKHR